MREGNYLPRSAAPAPAARLVDVSDRAPDFRYLVVLSKTDAQKCLDGFGRRIHADAAQKDRGPFGLEEFHPRTL